MRLKLPHLDPVRFAQDLISLTESSCTVSAEFPYPPTLAMITEAAAQSCAAFAPNNTDKVQIGFLVMLKDITLENKCVTKNVRIKLKVEKEMGEITYFNFIAEENHKKIAVGSFAVSIPIK